MCLCLRDNAASCSSPSLTLASRRPSAPTGLTVCPASAIREAVPGSSSSGLRARGWERAACWLLQCQPLEECKLNRRISRSELKTRVNDQVKPSGGERFRASSSRSSSCHANRKTSLKASEHLQSFESHQDNERESCCCSQRDTTFTLVKRRQETRGNHLRPETRVVAPLSLSLFHRVELSRSCCHASSVFRHLLPLRSSSDVLAACGSE